MNAYADFVTALQQLRRDDGHARFGAAKPCCDGCAEAAKVNPTAKPCCGGDAPTFGAAAPPAPTAGHFPSVEDIKNYAAYVDQRAKELDAQWSNWHHADCTPYEGTPDWWTCQNSKLGMQIAADDWSNNVVKANFSGQDIVGWIEWISNWNAYLTKLNASGGIGFSPWTGVIPTSEAQAAICGDVCGDFSFIKDRHLELIRYAAAAKDAGLPAVPDMGTPSELQSLPDIIGGSPVGSGFITVALIGAAAVIGYAVITGKKAR